VTAKTDVVAERDVFSKRQNNVEIRGFVRIVAIGTAETSSVGGSVDAQRELGLNLRYLSTVAIRARRGSVKIYLVGKVFESVRCRGYVTILAVEILV